MDYWMLKIWMSSAKCGFENSMALYSVELLNSTHNSDNDSTTTSVMEFHFYTS